MKRRDDSLALKITDDSQEELQKEATAAKKAGTTVKKIVKKMEPIQDAVTNKLVDVQANGLLPKKEETLSKKDFKRAISDQQLMSIREDLVKHHTQLILDAAVDQSARKELLEIVRKEQRLSMHGKEIAEYVVQEIVGTGFIEKILLDDSVTDIGWNGSFLTVQGSDSYQVYSKEDLELNDPEGSVLRIINRFANSEGKAFNPSRPILDGVFNHLRLSAVDKSLSPNGTTTSLRVVRPRLALTEEHFVDFAPAFVLDFFKVVMKTGVCMTIAGETGSGKTELLKLLLSFIPKETRQIVIEDVQETHIKELFPEHDVFAWVTSPEKSIEDLVKASLRFYPKYINVSETRGAEAYEMIQAALTDHKIVTTIHATDAWSIPRRLVNMCNSKYSINEEAVSEDVLTYFDFGVHIKTVRLVVDEKKNIFKIIRYLSEIVEFSPNGSRSIFKQKFAHGHFYVTTGILSEKFQERMAEKFLSFEFPEMQDEEIQKSAELTAIIKDVVKRHED